MKKIVILSWLLFFFFPLCYQVSANYKGDSQRELKFQNIRELSLKNLKIIDSGGLTTIMFNSRKIYESGWLIHYSPGESIEIKKPKILYAENKGKIVIVISESGTNYFSQVLIISNDRLKKYVTSFSEIKKAINYF